MRRFFAILISMSMILLPVTPSFARGSRYQLPTSYDGNQQMQSALSFRRDSQQRRFEPGTEPGMPQLNSPFSSALIDSASGAAMMYQVHVLGEVLNPGTYRVPASERLAEAIQQAGGLSENGSERWIELRRKGGGKRVVDLLRFKLYGDLSNNPYLMNNDVVFVPLRKKMIEVVGSVGRPNIYELRNERTLADAIALAGGITSAADKKDSISIVRFVDDKKTVKKVSPDKNTMNAFALMAGDVIVVPSVITKGTEFDYNIASVPGNKVFYPSYEDRVFVLGGVFSPGAYPFSPYYTVNKYVSLAGGLTDRGSSHYKVITTSGRIKKVGPNDRVNPGETLMIKKHWLAPMGWVSFAMSIASFGLSTTSTVLALTR